MDDALPPRISLLSVIDDTDLSSPAGGVDERDALPPPVLALCDVNGTDVTIVAVESALALDPMPQHMQIRGDHTRTGRHMVRRTAVTRVMGQLRLKKCCAHFCGKQFSSEQICGWQAKLRRLNKPDQDQLLFRMAKEAESSDRGWKFLGARVCRVAAFNLTGASGRLKCFRRAVLTRNCDIVPVDLRFVKQKDGINKLGKRGQDVDAFLRLVYWRAETLPDVKDEMFAATASLDDKPDELVVMYDKSLRKHEASARRALPNTTIGNTVGQQLEGPRYLQPGTWVEVFHMYQADRRLKHMKPASWTTFWRVWTTRWAQLLKHRGKFTHKKCNTCTRYKEVIKSVTPFESRDFWCFHYSLHLASQHRDREAYYHERQLSVDSSTGEIVGHQSTATIIIDAAGCLRFKVPRHLPGSKLLSDALRPTLTVIGVIAHGYHKAGYIMDASIGKDSNLFCTIMATTLSKIMCTCIARRLQFPSRIVVVFDNAGDNKNQWTFTMHACLVGLRLHNLGFAQSLRTGHSHEDIDAMFGNWGLCLSHQPTLQEPEDFRATLAKQFPDTQFELTHFCYDFKDVLNETCVKLAGFGGAVDAAHSFCFLRRAHLDTALYGEAVSEFAEPAAQNDVCLLVRKYMHVSELCQPPLVVLPASRVERVRRHLGNLTVLPRMHYSQKQKADLEKTAKTLSQFPFRLERSAAYLRALAHGTTHTGIPVPTAPSILAVREPEIHPSVAWVAPANLIEPSSKIKIVTAKPVASKKQLGSARSRTHCGKMKPMRGGTEPKGLDVIHGVVGLPEVGAYGDLLAITA